MVVGIIIVVFGLLTILWVHENRLRWLETKMNLYRKELLIFRASIDDMYDEITELYEHHTSKEEE